MNEYSLAKVQLNHSPAARINAAGDYQLKFCCSLKRGCLVQVFLAVVSVFVRFRRGCQHLLRGYLDNLGLRTVICLLNSFHH